MRFAQLVMGPAGCGKSTYCSTLLTHAETVGRVINCVNLDPAAETFNYQPLADLKELISVDDVMEDKELAFGPNGGLVFCMEYLLENSSWLEEQLGDYDEDYIIFDLPGQIELYTHMTVMQKLVSLLTSWNFRVAGVFILDSQFMVEGTKFISGALTALSVMTCLEIPHVNVLGKMDLVGNFGKSRIERFLEPDSRDLLGEQSGHFNDKYAKLHECIGKIIEDHGLVRFIPLDITDEESIGDLLFQIDSTIQYGEDMDVKVRDFDPPEAEEDNNDFGNID